MSHSYVIRPSGVTTRPSGPSSRRSSGMTAGLSGMARQTLQAGGRGGLFDLPGVPRLQKLRDLAHALVGDRPLLLVEDDLLVDRCRDGREHPDGPRIVGREQVREGPGRV